MVERAVVLAAGRGTRLGSITRTVPKPLIEIGGRPLLVRILDGLSAAGVERIVVVAGYLADTIVAALADRPRVDVVVQTELDGTAGAVRLAANAMGGHPFVYAWGDILIRPDNYRRVVSAAAGADAVIGVNWVDDPAAGAAVTVDLEWRVTGIVEKPSPGTSATNWNSAGIGVLGSEVWPLITALDPSPRGEYELTDAMAGLVASGRKVLAVPIEGPWVDIGTPESLARGRELIRLWEPGSPP